MRFAEEPLYPQSRDGAEIIAQHLGDCTDAKAAVVVDGSADDVIDRMTDAGWTLADRVDLIAGKRIRYLTAPYRRTCCDHCNNLEGDPDGHDFGDERAHNGPCQNCAADEAIRRRNEE